MAGQARVAEWRLAGPGRIEEVVLAARRERCWLLAGSGAGQEGRRADG